MSGETGGRITLDALVGRTVAVLTVDPTTQVGGIRTGVLRWGGKRGHRVVLSSGGRIYRRDWSLLVPLP